MNRGILGRIGAFLVAFLAAAFAAFAAYVFLTFSGTEWLPGFRLEVVATRAFALTMRFLVPTCAAAAAVAASLAGAAQAAGPRAAAPPTFARLVGPTVAVVLVHATGYAALAELVLPRAERSLADLRDRSALARVYREEARRAALASDWAAARDALDGYLVIDPGNTEAFDLATLYGTRVKAVSTPAPAAPADVETSAQVLYERATAAMDSKDWLIAHSLARRAAALDPRRVDAEQLAAAAWREAQAQAAGEKGLAAAALFREKKDAYALLDEDPIAAYYRFLALSRAAPDDADVRTLLADAVQRIEAFAFFVDEARRLEPLPGTRDILFLQRESAQATTAVSIGTMVALPDGGAYFFDIEAVRYDAAGAVAWHLRAPYGRRLGPSAAAGGTARSGILLRAIGRDGAGAAYDPVYLAGSRPAAERLVLLVAPTVEEMRALSTRGNALAGMSAADLFRLRARLGTFGLSRETLTVEMAMRMVMPFAFLAACLFAVSLGWAFRPRGGARVGAGAALLVPLVPAVLAVLTLLYVHAQRVVAGFAVLSFGLPVALVVLGVVQLAVLAGALVLLAGQSTR